MDLKNIGFYTLSDERVKNTSGTSQMKRVEIIITESCNFKCPYCRGLSSDIYGNRSVKELSLEEIKHVIELLCINNPIESIRFSGGEPTLHKNIKDIIAFSKCMGIKNIAISTNGSNSLELYRSLVHYGVNDFSISLDACCSEDGDRLSGGVKGSWDIVSKNIEKLSEICYVTVGVVLSETNMLKSSEIIRYAYQLGVSDIRIISSAQYNGAIPGLNEVEPIILESMPILRYRVNRFLDNKPVRGISSSDANRCALVLDDACIAGDFHFPCVIYMREKGKPIGFVSGDMRKERVNWFKKHDCFKDDICRKNCLDVCVAYNNKYAELRG